LIFEVIRTNCRICEIPTKKIKDLGNFYSCGIFPDFISTSVDTGNLQLNFCPECELVQLSCDFNSESLFTHDYGYKSSLNESMVDHLSQIALTCVNHLKSNTETPKYLDIGSNDGTLLNLVSDKFVKVSSKRLATFGIDPTAGKFKPNYGSSNIIESLFDYDLAKNLDFKFDVITSIAMLYDLPNPLNFFSGIKQVLGPDGIWVSEQSYLFSMIENNAFDTICHEHIEYYTVNNVNDLCAKVGLEIFDVDFNDVNGGSFRFYAQHVGGPNKISAELLKVLIHEKSRDIELDLFEMFERVEEIKYSVNVLLQSLTNQGKPVYGYGASTKGNTLLQYFEISTSVMPFIAERNENKYKKYTPGSLIPIISEIEAKARQPYAFFVLPWHFKEGILLRELQFRQRSGTKFIFPLPNLVIA
jgi:SAM-dependent methyltransferase